MNVIPIEQNLSDMDRMERFMRTGKRPRDSISAIESLDSFADDLPCDVEPTENNMRPDGSPIVHTGVLETKDREGA